MLAVAAEAATDCTCVDMLNPSSLRVAMMLRFALLKR